MNIRRWRAAARFFVLFVGLAIAALLVIFTADAFNLVLTPLGWWNLAAFEALLGWYAFDELFTRRERALWRKSVESPIGTGLRFWRKIVFLALAIGTLGAALIALTEHSARERALLAAGQFVVPEKSLSYIATLASVFIAAFGWMYTTFERDRADRSAATVKAVNDQLYSDHPSTVYQEVLALTLHVRKLRAIDASVALPLEAMGTRLSLLGTHEDVKDHRDKTLKNLVDEYFNTLDNLAYGVRRGQLDLRTIDMVLRARLIRPAFMFSNYIAEDTDAEPKNALPRRSRSRKWEHFLWLVDTLENLERSEASVSERIVRPPLLS